MNPNESIDSMNSSFLFIILNYSTFLNSKHIFGAIKNVKNEMLNFC